MAHWVLVNAMGQAVLSDAELLEACRQGHVQAFGTLVERYPSLAVAVCCSVTGDWSVSQDVAQETFLAAWSGQWASFFDLRGVEQDWAMGQIGHLLMDCMGDEPRTELEVTFTLDVAEGKVRGARATAGDPLGADTADIEACVARKLDDFGIRPKLGEPPELDVRIKRTEKDEFDTDGFAGLDLNSAPTRGSAQAKVDMVVFTGLRCVYCGAHLGTVDRLLEEYGGQIRLIVRPISLSAMEDPITEAVYAAQAQGRSGRCTTRCSRAKITSGRIGFRRSRQEQASMWSASKPT